MKIAKFTYQTATRLGVVEGDTIADLGAVDGSFPTDIGQLLEAGRLGEVGALAAKAPRLSLGDVHLEAPIARPPEFLAIGLNYHDHVAESAMTKTVAPIVFNKQSTCVNGPFDPIHIPRAAPDHVDYEGELGIVIGQRCREVSVADAHKVVAGYIIVNDVSVRDWQRATPTMTMGKSWDTHGPIGPWMVTADEITDPHNLRIQTWVNGEKRQDASTSLMITNCWEQIAHITTACTLLPGTIIATGTPAGVGIAMNPPGVLHPGSSVRIEIDRIGHIEATCIAQP